MSDRPDWVEQARQVLAGLGTRLGDSLHDAAARTGGEAAAHAADCRWCPLCQAAAVARGERPEVTAALADLVGAAATALRVFVEAGGPAPDREEEAEERDPVEPRAAQWDAAEPEAVAPQAEEWEADESDAGGPVDPGSPVQRIEIA